MHSYQKNQEFQSLDGLENLTFIKYIDIFLSTFIQIHKLNAVIICHNAEYDILFN